MPSAIISSLEIEVKTKADEAAKKIDKLTTSMGSLRDVVSTAISPLKELSQTLGSISNASLKMSGMSKVYKQAAQGISEMGEAYSDFAEVKQVVKETQDDMPVDYFNESNATHIKQMTMEEALHITKLQELRFQIDQVTEAMKEELEATGGNTAKTYALSKKYQELSAQYKKVSSAGGYMNESLQKSMKTMRKFASSLGRIALYRVLRSVIKGIGEALNEGLTNAYQFSKLMGGDLANSMDRFASVSLQMKNQIGALFGELRVAINPLVESIMQNAIGLANTLTQVMAVFNGDSTYKKAQYVSTAWQDATDSAKAYKNQLLGIDELNVISENTSSSSKDAADYASMFKYSAVTLSSGWKKTITWIKDNFADILLTVTSIATALKVWRISRDVTKALSEIGLITGKTAMKVPIGIALSVTGFMFEFNGAYNLGKQEQIQLKDVLKTVIGGALGIGGLALAFGTTGLMVGIPIAVTLGIVAYEFGVKKAGHIQFDESEMNARLDELQQIMDERYSITLEIQARIEARQSSIDSIIDDVSKAKALIDRILYLDDKSDKTSTEMYELKSLVESLNSMNINGLHIDLDPDGKIVQTREELDNVVKDLLITKLQDTALEDLASAWYDIQKQTSAVEGALYDLGKAKEEQAVATEMLNKANAEYAEYMENTGYSLVSILGPATRDYKTAITEAEDAVKKASERVQAATQYYEDANKTLEDANEQYKFYTEVLGDAQTAAESILSSIDAQTNAYRGMRSEIDETINSLSTLNAMQVGHSISIEGKADGGIIKSFANGGFPHGQLFVANEGTSPEMVGSWGNQSAVANTDQIVNGIQNGVSNAVSNVLAPYLMQIANNTLKSANKNLSVNIGDRDIARANNRGQRMLGATIMS